MYDASHNGENEEKKWMKVNNQGMKREVLWNDVRWTLICVAYYIDPMTWHPDGEWVSELVS